MIEWPRGGTKKSTTEKSTNYPTTEDARLKHILKAQFSNYTRFFGFCRLIPWELHL